MWKFDTERHKQIFKLVIFVNVISVESNVAVLSVVQSQIVLSLAVPWLTTTIWPDISSIALYSVDLLAAPDETTV